MATAAKGQLNFCQGRNEIHVIILCKSHYILKMEREEQYERKVRFLI